MTKQAQFGPQDDNFHFAQMSDRWWMSESAWYSFNIPERKMGGWLYANGRPNMRNVTGGLWIWDETAQIPWELPYYANYTVMRFDPSEDLRDMTFSMGMSVKMLEPLKRYKLGYEDGDRVKLDMEFDAVMPPRALKRMGSSFGSMSHFDQFGHVTGTLELLGETIPIDCLAMRDRSWGPRPEHRPNKSAYVTGITEDHTGFLAGTVANQDSRELAYGFFMQDGETFDLAKGERRVQRDPDHGYVTEIEIAAEDEGGRKLHAVGRRLSSIFINKQTYIDSNGLIEWEINGKPGHGEDQDLWPVHQWADFRREQKAAR